MCGCRCRRKWGSWCGWRWIRWAGTFIVLALAICGVIFGFNNVGSSTELQLYESAGAYDGVVLVGHITQVDLIGFNMTVAWAVSGCGIYRDQREVAWSVANNPGGTLGNCGRLGVPLQLYTSGNDVAPTWTFDPTHTAAELDGLSDDKDIIGVYWSSAKLSVYSYAAPFRRVLQSWTHNRLVHGLQYFDLAFFYPFDVYSAIHTFVAVTTSTSDQTPEIIPILRAAAVDSTNNWVPHRNTEHTANITFNGTVTNRAYLIRPEVRRSTFASVFAISIFVTNWIFTVFVIFLALKSTFARSWGLETGVLLLPASLIFSLPNLRALFVGSPPFGILLDYIGIFLQIPIVAICAGVLIFHIGSFKKPVYRGDGTQARRQSVPGDGTELDSLLSRPTQNGDLTTPFHYPPPTPGWRRA